jgi:hypothetical protein
MADDIDRLFAAAAHEPPPDFAARVAALARACPQASTPRSLSLWQCVSLAAGAGFGALLVGEFAFFAFVAAAAQ